MNALNLNLIRLININQQKLLNLIKYSMSSNALENVMYGRNMDANAMMTNKIRDSIDSFPKTLANLRTHPVIL